MVVLAAIFMIAIVTSIYIYGTYGQTKSDSFPSIEQSRIYLNYGELVAMPRTTVYAELDCIGTYVDNGNWTGVRVEYLLEKAGVTQQADTVELYARDGYSTHISYLTATRDDVIVAYEKDGSELPETTRLVVPDTNGDVWISKIARIKVVFPSGNYSSLILN